MHERVELWYSLKKKSLNLVIIFLKVSSCLEMRLSNTRETIIRIKLLVCLV